MNVGGGGKLPMPELRAACEEAGLESVATYIASGNLICESADSATDVQARIIAILRDRFDQPKPAAILRSPDDLARTIHENPFPDAAEERPSRLLVAFADGAPTSGAAEALAAYRGPERISLQGDRVYIDYLDGVGRSKLTPAVLNRALKIANTARNWNTIRKLAAMATAR